MKTKLPKPSFDPLNLRARREHFSANDNYTPYLSDGDTARVLAYFNLSGAYNGYKGKEKADADARFIAIACKMLPGLIEAAEDFVAKCERGEAKSVKSLAKFKAALAVRL